VGKRRTDIMRQQRSTPMFALLQIMVVVFLSSLRASLSFQSAWACQRMSPSFLTTASSSSNKAANSDDEGNVSESKLIDLAKGFLCNKNAAGSGESSLDGVFDMCSDSVDLYGLTAADVRPGFTAFFKEHQNLYHELMGEPSVIGPGVVQYPFVKRWTDKNGEHKVWKSIDAEKPRNKVERLLFDDEGQIAKVSVVEAETPLVG